MFRVVHSLLALVMSITLLTAGNSLLSTLLSVRLSMEGYSPGVIGPILVLYSFGFVAGSLYCDRVIRRVGHIRAFAVFAALAGVAALLYPMLVSGYAWAVLRAMTGFCMAGLLVVIESWISTRATNANRGTLFAVYQVTFYLASAAGQGLMAVSNPSAYQAFSLIAIIICLSLIPLSLTHLEAPQLDTAERLSFRSLYRISPIGLIGAFSGGLLLSAFAYLGPVYARLVGLSIPKLSLFMALSVFSAMLFAWPAGRLSDGFGRRRMLLGVATVTGLSSLVAAMVGTSYMPALFAFMSVSMGLAAALYPISVAVMNDYLHNEQIVAASAGLLLSYGLGTCVGPLGGSLAMHLFGPPGLFLFNAGSMLLLLIYGVYRVQSSEDVPVEEQEEYVPAPAMATPVIVEIDPRNVEFEVVPTAGEPGDENVPDEPGEGDGP